MKKMMFNDRYGLTQAVISGRKTVTRRIVDPQGKYEKLRWWQPCLEFEECLYGYTENEGWEVIEPRYNVGEIVAVAQRYDSFLHPNNGVIEHDYQTTALASKGWDNKMFVKADLMPHQIQIRDLRIERLQDISDDYFKEGITLLASADDGRIQWGYADEHLRYYMFDSPREAFASLIDKVSGKGTWDRNPFVWRIEFQLVK
ncbi:hypothetical protein [Alistipes ihumii]|jgi:hypothetical protein|uniref:hypothetical protein n=1 Tax=Alistipes ihumii TaxID=1470347 RepID=UPI0039F4774E